MSKRPPYQVMLVGMSGRGKTMAFRNMNRETCGFINMEGKPLPFENEFKYYSTPISWQECYQKLIEFAKNDEITEVVLDSFSAYLESLLKTARETKRGFDIWNFYNDEIGKLLNNIIKRYPKDIFVTSHYEWVESEEGAVEKRVMVKGKEWKGMVEKEFTIVHFADMKILDGKRNYFITLNSDGKSSAKTPPLFLINDEETITNDYSIFLERIKKSLTKK
jgi:hypothetical protein